MNAFVVTVYDPVRFPGVPPHLQTKATVEVVAKGGDAVVVVTTDGPWSKAGVAMLAAALSQAAIFASEVRS